MNKYDVIVVGAGHAGIEAANACAKIGCRVLLLTLDIEAVGKLSCNPEVPAWQLASVGRTARRLRPIDKRKIRVRLQSGCILWHVRWGRLCSCC